MNEPLRIKIESWVNELIILVIRPIIIHFFDIDLI